MNYTLQSNKILEISANEDVYARGEAYYREGKLVSLHARRQKDNSIIKAAVKGNYRNYDVSLQFDGKGELKLYNCSCASQSIWHGGCKHVVAVLFALSDGRASSGVRSSNKKNQEAITDILEKLILQEIDEILDVPCKLSSSRLAKLTPYFQYKGGGEATLTFYVGYSRMYIIKSLTKLLQAVSQETTVRYGNGLEFNHHLGSFTVQARRWLNFLKQEEEIYGEMVKRINKHYPYAIMEDTRELPLTRRNIDRFFDLCKGEDGTAIEGEMSLLTGETKQENLIHLTTEMPDIHFEIIDAEELTLKGPVMRYKVLKGQKHYYFLAKNKIHRMSKVEAKILIQLLDALNEPGVSALVFEGYARRRFISAVLPKLVTMGLVNDKHNVGNTEIAPSLRTKIYFDLEGTDVVGRVVFAYDNDNMEEQYDAFDHRESDCTRDIAGEYIVKRLLEGVHFTADTEGRVFRLSGSDNIFAFMGDNPPGIEKFEKLEHTEIYVTDDLRGKTVTAFGATLGVRLKAQLLDIYVQNANFTLEELVEALESYRERKKYHRLKDGRLLSLTNKDTVDMVTSLAAMDADPKDIQEGTLALPVYRAPYVEGLVNDQNTAFKNLMKQFHKKKGFKIPPSLKNTLRPYQKQGYQWLKTLTSCGFGGILADDMGLGKTLQVLAVLLESDFSEHSALVIAPTSLIYNWAAEIKKFAPSLSFAVVAGSPEKRLEILKTSDANIFITTYDSMKRDAEVYQNTKYKYIIADEAQNIKNPSTKNAKIIKSIEAEHRIALTGTPIENTLTELWSIFDFVMPGYLHNARKFNTLYEIPITKDNDKEKAARLKEQIAPFILRRLKSSVLSELPPKTETTLMAEMLPEQQKLYMAHLLKAKGELKELLSAGTLKSGRLQILAQLTRLRQICCHPSLCIENYRGGSGKLDLALETIQIAIESGHRCLLFSQFTRMLGILQKSLKKAGVSFFYLDGATGADERIDRVNRFNNGEADVFLISLKAGGTGLNLTGADIVIHYDPWWNPSVMDQASDRAHRMGQNKAVQVFNLVAMQTLEERIIDLQDKKRKLIENVITEEIGDNLGSKASLQVLTDVEIEELLAMG